MKRSRGWTIGPASSERAGNAISGEEESVKYEAHSKLGEIESRLRRARFKWQYFRTILSIKKPFYRWRTEWRVLWTMVPTGVMLLAAWSVYVFAPIQTGWIAGLAAIGLVYATAAWTALFGSSALVHASHMRESYERYKRLAARRQKVYRKEARRVVRAAADEVETGLDLMEKAKNGSTCTTNERELKRIGEVAEVLNRSQPSLKDLAGTSLVKSMLGRYSASVFGKVSQSAGSHGMVESMTSDTKADKLMKLFTRSTSQGKANIAIDMIFHGKGRGATVLDELLHSINEGGFSTGKFLSYGNGKKLLGKTGGSVLGAAKSASSTFRHASSGSPIKATKSAYGTGKKVSKWL